MNVLRTIKIDEPTSLILYKACQTPPRIAVFALSGIASQNATQIDAPCDSKCHMCRTYVRYKKPEVVWQKNSVSRRMAMD